MSREVTLKLDKFAAGKQKKDPQGAIQPQALLNGKHTKSFNIGKRRQSFR
jgi:hypothetical protein